MSGGKRRLTRTAGVSLEIVVLDYLRELADRDERNRSYCINQIVREHAQRHGRPLPPPVAAPRLTPNRSPQEQ